MDVYMVGIVYVFVLEEAGITALRFTVNVVSL